MMQSKMGMSRNSHDQETPGTRYNDDDNEQAIPIIMASPSYPSGTTTSGNNSNTNGITIINDFWSSALGGVGGGHATNHAPEAQVVTIDECNNGENTPLVSSSYAAQQYTRTTINYNSNNNSNYNDFDDEVCNVEKEYKELPVFRDWPFGILFWIHISAMIYVGVVYSSEGYQRLRQDFNWTQVEQAIAETDDVDVTQEDLAKFETFMEDVSKFIQVYPKRILMCSKLPAAILSLLYLDVALTWIIRPFAQCVVASSLLCSVSFFTVIMVALVIAEPTVFSIVLASIIIGAVLYFVCRMWPLIPFVSTNLKVALEGIGANLGTYLWALIFSDLCLVFVLLWLYVFLGVAFLEHAKCEDRKHPGETHLEEYESNEDDCSMNGWTFLLLILSLYWTTNVIINFIRVTVAGVMATWLYAKEDARGCCSSAIWGSLLRGMTYSFGSVCLGSLLQGLVAVLRWITSKAKRNHMDANTHPDCCGGLCFCIVDCIANLGGEALDYFSQWNYIYIALYGLSYVESGKKVMRLFKARGWESIITERLTNYTLHWVTFHIGLVTGASVLFIEWIVTMRNPDPEYESYVYGPIPHWRIVAFTTGFMMGIVVSVRFCVSTMWSRICGRYCVWIIVLIIFQYGFSLHCIALLQSIMMHVVKGAVNTLIVCWADNPSQIEENHPVYAKELISSWIRAFPDSVTHEPHQSNAIAAAAPSVVV